MFSSAWLCLRGAPVSSQPGGMAVHGPGVRAEQLGEGIRVTGPYPGT
ncbi:hypothetical protein [Streptomyces ureilyticus]